MNDNNFNEGNGFTPSGDNNAPEVKAPETPVQRPETPAERLEAPVQRPVQPQVPIQPQTPVQRPEAPVQPQQGQIPPQNYYRPAQNGQNQYNPYGANQQMNRNGGYPNQTPYQNPDRNVYQQYPYNGQYTQIQKPQGGKGRNLAIILIALCAIIAVICIAIGMINFDGGEVVPESTTNPTGTSQTTNAEPTSKPDSDTTINDSMNVSTTAPSQEVVNSVYVAQKVRPSVVGIMTYKRGQLTGEGSGVLMSEKDGWTYIVTCAHVIDGAGVEYGVLFLDGTTLEAELVAYDTRTDIGVIKVHKTGLPLAEFGDSSSLLIGEPIYAIGNPGGSEYFGSITDGIIASIDRSVTSTYTMTCIQHNAAINPGNSGGALVNSSGQVIGINSSKIASTEFEGMGFAVPTSIAGPVVDALINYGYVPNRPKLGIEYAPVSSYQLYSIIVSVKGLPQGSLVIASITEDSGLSGTEAQVGDLIIAVNGQDMTSSSVLLDLIEKGNVGDTLTLTLARISSRNYSVETFDVVITLVEDKGN